LAEVGFDLRGTWVHRLAIKMFRREVPAPPKKPAYLMTRKDLKAARSFKQMCSLDCFCEPCVRSFFPWPFNW